MQMLSAINSVFTPVTPTINTTLDNQSNNLLNYQSTYPVANPYAKNHNLRGLQLYLISGGITILISLTGFGLIKFITEKENLKTSDIANSRNSVNQKSSSSKEQIQTTNQETSNPTNIISANPNRQPVTPNTIETFKSTPNSSNQTYNNQLNSHHFNSFYFISDAAFANYSKASEYVESLKFLGYPQAGMFWIPDYPNLSGKSLFTVYPARFDNRQSCRNFLRQYAQNKPEAYCAFASKDKNASPDRFYSRW
jgi:hypothetical protein